MKSEKAKQHLSRWAMNPNSPIAQDQNYVWRDVSVIEAIEIAEQEAEERMRERAIEAYCDWCFVGITRECQVSKACCNDLQDFIQILDEKKGIDEYGND